MNEISVKKKKGEKTIFQVTSTIFRNGLLPTIIGINFFCFYNDI